MPRQCKKCGETYPATAAFFEVNKACRLGITYQCKKCDNADAKTWRDNNKSLIVERWQTRYNVKHGLARKAREEYNGKHFPEKTRAYRLVHSVTERSKKCGIPYDVSVINVDFLTNLLVTTTKCPICESTFMYRHDADKKLKAKNVPSIDKIIPVLGYVKDNIAIICWRCNVLKSDATLEYLEKLVTWLRQVTPKQIKIGITQ